MEKKPFRNGSLLAVPLILGFLLFLSPVSAHQPRLVMGLSIHDEKSAVAVESPNISKAYYGQLAGSPDYYTFVLDNATDMYFSILVPDVQGEAKAAVSIEVYNYLDNSSRTQSILLDGAKSEWKPYYEPFGGDWYLKGPESKVSLPAGTHYIRVFSQDNTGKYSLAVGDVESFPPAEIANTYTLMPVIKERFFGKPVFFLFFQYLGISLALGPMFVIAAFFISAKPNKAKAAIRTYAKSRGIIWTGMVITGLTMAFTMVRNPLNLLGILMPVIFVILLAAFISMNARIRKANEENLIRAGMKAGALFSAILWLLFLLLSAALI